MSFSNALFIAVILTAVVGLHCFDECEVCIGFLERLYKDLISRHKELSLDVVERGLAQACKASTGKESRLCYYLGAAEDSAARVTGEVTRPLSAHVPPVKICQRLQKRDSQICELHYEKRVLDWSGESLSKLRVLELKRLLASWGEECRACLEKSEFIQLIQQVAPKHNSQSAGAAHAGHSQEL